MKPARSLWWRDINTSLLRLLSTLDIPGGEVGGEITCSVSLMHPQISSQTDKPSGLTLSMILNFVTPVFFFLLWTSMHFAATLHPSEFSCIFRLNCTNENVVRSVTFSEPYPINNNFNTWVNKLFVILFCRQFNSYHCFLLLRYLERWCPPPSGLNSWL